jgi:hypothetical protein
MIWNVCVVGFLLFSSADPVLRRLFRCLFLSLSLVTGQTEKRIYCFSRNQQRLWLLDSISFLLLMIIIFFLTGNAFTPLLCCIFRVLLSTAAILPPMSRPTGQTRRVLCLRSSTLKIPLKSMSRSLSPDATSSMKSLVASRHKITGPAAKVREAANGTKVADDCIEWLQSG